MNVRGGEEDSGRCRVLPGWGFPEEAPAAGTGGVCRWDGGQAGEVGELPGRRRALRPRQPLLRLTLRRPGLSAGVSVGDSDAGHQPHTDRELGPTGVLPRGHGVWCPPLQGPAPFRDRWEDGRLCPVSGVGGVPRRGEQMRCGRRSAGPGRRGGHRAAAARPRASPAPGWAGCSELCARAGAVTGPV